MFNRIRRTCHQAHLLAWCFVIIAAMTLSACGGSDGSAATAGVTNPSSAVNALAAAPVVNGTPPTIVEVGTEYRYVPSVSNAPGGTLSFEITGAPEWVTFDTSTGEIEGTPDSSNLGTSGTIEITVTNGTNSAIIGPFRIKVVPASSLRQGGEPPTIGGTPAKSVVAGRNFDFTPVVTNPDNESLSFAIVNRPAWASFNPETGMLSGTPTSANVGTYANIQISVSDGSFTSTLPAFTIAVTDASSQDPTIAGAPPTAVNAGSNYGFTPSTTDPSGNSLTFSIQNMPSWATFSAQSGTLSGTPDAADAGTYANIIISVSDGSTSASLAPFSITVMQGGTGSATLAWNAPTQNTNGTALTNLAGFHIYYGNSPSHLNQTVTISNSGVTDYVVGNLGAGTWYFSINAYTASGAESSVSNVASLTIQ
jgi:hypothetical protein